MNTKYLLAVGAIVTSLTLGACGNSNSESDHANHKDKQQEDSNVKQTQRKNYLVILNLKRRKVEGKAKIENGKLMLENYKSSKGPDLYVYLTKNGDTKSGKKISTVDYNKSKQTFDLKCRFRKIQ